MLMGMLYLYLSDSISQDPESRVYYIISAWASALLVTDKMGDARASYRGTSDKFRLPRFFYTYSTLFNHWFRESAVIVTLYNLTLMNQTNYWKLLCCLGFIAFASVSCWATAESLNLLLTTWPKVLCWIVTIGFFIIASFGTKLIIDSLNQNIYMEKRGLSLTLGLFMVIIFWLCCSMPTNTHTFLYRTTVDGIVSNDISTTKGYLNEIKNNTNNKIAAKAKIDDLNKKIEIILGELKAEIESDANPGHGPKAKEILRKFAELLTVDKIEPLSYKGISVQERQKLYDAYRKKVYILRDARARDIEISMLYPNPENLKEVDVVDKNLAIMSDAIHQSKLDLNKSEDIKEVCDRLTEGYNAVNKNRDFVKFKNLEDNNAYTASKPVTKAKRLISVFDVWSDFLSGNFNGHGFIFWIVISILVDIAAFIFFDIAFKKTC